MSRLAAISSLGYLDSDIIASTARPTILAALASPDQAIAAAALLVVYNTETLHSAEIESLLVSWLPNVTDADLYKLVTRTLSRVRSR